ncbi:MAG: hypothetical protein LC746_13665 [Acidobacteria bacterium]|nr:hypothetical protein [Acidobacteriota bacterium]
MVEGVSDETEPDELPQAPARRGERALAQEYDDDEQHPRVGRREAARPAPAPVCPPCSSPAPFITAPRASESDV